MAHRRSCRTALAAALVVLSAHATRAQVLRGAVRDSASRQPIAGVVLLLLDASGATLGRNLTNERGEYRVALAPAMRRVRAIRIGFRPRVLAIPAPDAGVARLDIEMSSIPTLLEPVTVRSNPSCPRRSDAGVAFALLEQARAGLLATIVAREANPAALIRLKFERTMDGTSDRIDHQTVALDSTRASTTSFIAVRSGSAFVEQGFVQDSAGMQVFLGPDAEALLDDSFAAGYCFRVADPDAARPTQVGLGFSAASRRGGRVDITGTVWIDTLDRALSGIEYRYVGLIRPVQALRPGGHIEFRAMPNGVVFIDRWALRLFAASLDTVVTARGNIVRRVFTGIESGGEVARARWPDGAGWDGALGTLRLRVPPDSVRADRGTVVRLAGTDYATRLDANGTAEIPRLLPGPYTLGVVDPRFAPIDLLVPTGFTFAAARDSTIERTLELPAAEDYVAGRCVAARRYDVDATALLFGRVMTRQGTPVKDVRVEVLLPAGGGDWRPIRDWVRTGGDGVFQFCAKVLVRGTTVRIRATRDGSAPVEREQTLTDPLTVIRIPYAPPR